MVVQRKDSIIRFTLQASEVIHWLEFNLQLKGSIADNH